MHKSHLAIETSAPSPTVCHTPLFSILFAQPHNCTTHADLRLYSEAKMSAALRPSLYNAPDSGLGIGALNQPWWQCLAHLRPEDGIRLRPHSFCALHATTLFRRGPRGISQEIDPDSFLQVIRQQSPAIDQSAKQQRVAGRVLLSASVLSSSPTTRHRHMSHRLTASVTCVADCSSYKIKGSGGLEYRLAAGAGLHIW